MLVFGVSDLILISKNAILLISMPRSSDFSSLTFPLDEGARSQTMVTNKIVCQIHPTVLWLG